MSMEELWVDNDKKQNIIWDCSTIVVFKPLIILNMEIGRDTMAQLNTAKHSIRKNNPKKMDLTKSCM